MKDAEFLFHQTSIEAKRTARGAFSKKGGARSKKCTMPSDYLTEKQKKEMNGKVERYNLTKPTDWKTFKSWPVDIQRGWLSYMAGVNKGRLKDVAALLAVTENTLGVYMKSRDIKGVFPRTGRKTPYPEWEAFLKTTVSAPSELSSAEPILEHVEPDKTDPVSPSAVQQPIPVVDVSDGHISYVGKPAAIFEMAFRALEPDAKYRISVTFSKFPPEGDKHVANTISSPKYAPYDELSEELGVTVEESY